MRAVLGNQNSLSITYRSKLYKSLEHTASAHLKALKNSNNSKNPKKNFSPELPTSKRHYKSVVVGKQHIYKHNEESYFSRW